MIKLLINEWNNDWQKKMDLIQKELGYFKNFQISKYSESEYPDL